MTHWIEFRESEKLSKDFLLIGRNAWLSQQISPNSTMKILGTKLIEVCCGLFETLDLDWSSPSTLSASDLVSEGRELYSSPLFWEVIFQPYQYRFFVLNFCKAAAEVIIQTYLMRVARHFEKIAQFWSRSIIRRDHRAHLQFFCTLKTAFQKRLLRAR